MLAGPGLRALTRQARTSQVVQRMLLPTAIFSRASSSSTSAITFKSHRHRRHFPPLPTPPAPTAEQAVTNLLYNTPDANLQPTERRVLNCLVQDEPGVLSRVSGILAGRGFNIESLVVAKTEVPDLSRMTIVVRGQEATVEQARRQLEDLVPVWAVLDYTGTRLLEREMLLIKVSTLGPEQEAARQRAIRQAAALDEGLQLDDSEPIELPNPTEMLRETQDNLRALSELTNLFRGQIVDVSADSVIIELCAKPNRIEAFIKLVQPYGILEAARSGVMAMPRSALPDSLENNQTPTRTEPTVDATMLPPG
jgi:acetolactate synthase-1/3 small subunit